MIPVVGPPSAAYPVVDGNVPARATGWYRAAVVALWTAGVSTGVDPVVLAAQCAHETGWGNFGGAITPDMGNTCGLKVRDAKGDTKADHATFPMRDGFPMVGALAHAHHLLLYSGFPVPEDTPDPRAVWVGPGTSGFGSARFVESLGGKWAPAADYGKRVAELVRLLRGQANPIVINIQPRQSP